MGVGNLISGSSAFSKSSLNIWKFTVHVLLKPGLEKFEHYFASLWDECNCALVWTFFGIAFPGIGMKTDFFQSCGHCWVFQICWHIECSTLKPSSFRIWNSSIGIPSPCQPDWSKNGHGEQGSAFFRNTALLPICSLRAHLLFHGSIKYTDILKLRNSSLQMYLVNYCEYWDSICNHNRQNFMDKNCLL